MVNGTCLLAEANEAETHQFMVCFSLVTEDAILKIKSKREEYTCRTEILSEIRLQRGRQSVK